MQEDREIWDRIKARYPHEVQLPMKYAYSDIVNGGGYHDSEWLVTIRYHDLVLFWDGWKKRMVFGLVEDTIGDLKKRRKRTWINLVKGGKEVEHMDRAFVENVTGINIKPLGSENIGATDVTTLTNVIKVGNLRDLEQAVKRG